MTFAPLLLSLAAVGFFALSEQRGRVALGACAAALAAWAFCVAHGPVRGPVIALVFVMGEASALVLLAGARPRWIAPLAKGAFVLGAVSLMVQWT